MRWNVASIGLLALAAAAALLAPRNARADGFRFDGDLPASPHVVLELTDGQLRELREGARPAGAWPEAELTREQRARLSALARADVRWVFAVARAALEGECSCGTYNLGIRVGERGLAVLLDRLGDALGSRDVGELERALVDPGLAVATPGPPAATDHPAPGGGLAPPLRALAARFPARGFEREVKLAPGWRAQTIRVAGLPRLGFDGSDVAPSLHALAAVRAGPAPGAVIRWPELGARLDADGRVYLLVPGVAQGEMGAPTRAWFLLAYRGGLLEAALGVTEWGDAGTSYAWSPSVAPRR